MSKSRGNLVRLSDQLTYLRGRRGPLDHGLRGTAGGRHRLGRCLSRGLRKFLARALRLAQDVTSAPDGSPVTGDLALRSITHRTRSRGRQPVEGFRFNVAVARVMELVNATRKAIDSGPGASDPAVREAAEAVAILLSLFAPYVAEEMWALLGYPTVALRDGRRSTRCFLSRTVTCIVQVQARCGPAWRSHRRSVRTSCGRWRWPTRPSSARWTDATIRTVIVRAPKLVNVVPA